MKLVNLTPHPINLGHIGNPLLGVTINPSGKVARVTMKATPINVGTVFQDHPDYLPAFVTTIAGDVYDLPDPVDGTIYIVSNMVRVALPSRGDLASPFDLVRDDQGRILGAHSLATNQRKN